MNTLGWQELKVVALAVDDLARAEDFTAASWASSRGRRRMVTSGFALGGLTLLLKPLAGPGGAAEKSPLHPRLTVAVADAPRMEQELAARGVTISDAVQLYEDGRYWVGAFLDSGATSCGSARSRKPAPSVLGLTRTENYPDFAGSAR